MCNHENFICKSRVGRISEEEGGPIDSYRLEIKISCSDCNEEFEFIGVDAGYTPMHPTVSADFLELRCPIKPSSEIKPDLKAN